MQDLRDLVTQLMADNEHLLRERAEGPGPLAATQSSFIPPSGSSSVNVPSAERLVFIPRDRKSPMFWEEEVQACIRARHLSSADQAFFLLDHLKGETREEIKYCSSYFT